MTIEMINKNKFRVASDKKLLRKVGKQWVVVGTLALVLLGGGAVITTTVTHADTNSPAVEAQNTNSVKKQINSNLDKAYQATQSASGSSVASSNSDSNGTKATQPGAKSIMKTASLLHANMLNNEQKSNTVPSSASAKSNVASQSASSVSSKVSSSNDAMNTFTLGTPAQQKRGWNYVQNGVKNNDFDNTKPSSASSSSSATQSASSSAGASSVAPSNSVSVSAKPSFNASYMSYEAQMSGTDSEVASANAGNVQFNNKNINKPVLKDDDNATTQPSDNHWIYDDGKYISSMPSTDDIFTGTYDGLTYKYDDTLGVLEFTGGKINVKDTGYFLNVPQFSGGGSHDADGNPENHIIKIVKFDNGIDTTNVSDMNRMFASDKSLRKVYLSSDFNTSNVTSMNKMFRNDYSLHDITLPASFNTNKVVDMRYMFLNDRNLQSVTLSTNFNTIHKYSFGIFTGDTKLHTITIKSPNTKISLRGLFSSTRHSDMYKETGDLDSDNNQPYTLATPNDFTQGNIGTFTTNKNPEQVSDTVVFYTNRNGYNVRVGSDVVSDIIGTQYSVRQAFNSSGISGYTLAPHTPRTITLTNGAMHKVEIENYQQSDTSSDDVPVVGNTVTFTGNIILNFPERGRNHQITVPYSINTQVDDTLKDILSDGIENGNPSVAVPSDYVGRTIQQFNTQNFTYQNANSSQANTYDNVYVQPADGTDNAAHVMKNQDGSYTYNNPDITFNFTANTVSETIHYQYNGKDISNNPKDANGNQETNDKNTTTVSGANDTQGSLASNNVPAGWHIATGANGEPNGNNSWIYGNEDADKPQGSHNVNVMPNEVNTIIQYQVSNGHILNTVRKTGNDYRAIDAGNNYFDVTSSNDINMPKGYQLVNTVNKVPYDNGTHDIAIEPLPSFINVIEYIDNNGQGSDVGDTEAYGQEGTDVPNKVIEDDIPKDYQLSPNQILPVQFTKNNVIPIAVQNSNGKGDMVVGTAFLTLLYQKGNHTEGQVLRLHINGNIGDSDIVINPQDYDKPGYSVASSDNDWHIPFKYSDVTKFTHDFSRYNREHTFIYEAKPVDIDIKYVDTQTGQSVTNPVNNQNVTAYDGDTIDLEDAKASNGIISVDGHDYNLQLPDGYHLAHANNYIKVTANGTYVKKVSNGLGGFRMVRMPLMKLTLGITPHKPNTSSASVTPVIPSSASSVTSQSASSANAGMSLVPTVPSDTIVPSASATFDTIPSNTTASVIPMIDNANGAEQLNSASVPVQSLSSNTSKAGAKSITNHERAKKAAKHNRERLNYQIAKSTHTLNGVKRHMKARRAAHAKWVIKHARRKLRYLRQHKQYAMHALRRITRNKVTIRHAKEQLTTAHKFQPFYVEAKRTVLIHTKSNAIGHLRAYCGFIRPKQLQKYLVIGKKAGHYVIMYHGHRRYITANHNYVHNAYYQSYDLRQKHNNRYSVKILRDCYEYSKRNFNPRYYVRNIHQGTVLKVRRVVTISKYHMTRFQLTNGHWITANKNFVHLIK